MKNKLQQFIVKLLAATLAIIMAVPTNVFAMSQRKSNTYTAATSVMGIQTKDDAPEEVADTETSLLKSAVSTAESTDYIIEKSATLSKTTGKLDYKIVLKTKDPSKEFTENQTTTFGITENTDLKDLKVEKVQALDADGKEIDVKNTLNTPKAFNNTDNLRTLGLTATKPQYGMVYYLSAQLTEEALKNLEEKSPQLALDITIASPNQDIFQTRYSLETTKADSTEITIDNDGNVVNQTSELVEKEDNLHLYKGEYKQEEKTLFQTTPAHLVWTDYINAKDDKEFTINFDLDENQDTENSQINIDYYEARDKGYVLNQSFSKTVDFTNSLNLTIPQGYIAKVSLSTAIKENTNAKEYTFNGVKVANPTYKEEKTEKTEEEQATDDADPLPDNSSKNDEEANPSNDSIADESEQDFSQNPKSDTSAIALNKEAYLENLRGEEKLTENLEKATNDIELALESYNKEETNWDEFKATIQTIAKEQNLDPAQTEEILQALLAGLNEDKYKVANIDTKEATNLVGESTVQSKPTDATEKSVDELVKEKLNEEGITVEDFQNYMYELEEKYGLTNEDVDRIYGDNAEAIQVLVKKARQEKTTGDVFAAINPNQTYPYDINYYAYQYYEANKVFWEIQIKTSEVNLDYLNFDKLSLNIYAPTNQGISDYKITVKDNPEGLESLKRRDRSNLKLDGTFPNRINLSTTDLTKKNNGNIVDYHTTFSKGGELSKNLPNDIFIRVEATLDPSAPKYNSYDLGIRLTPDNNYIKDILDDFNDDWAKLVAAMPWILPYKSGEAAAKKFVDGFNVVDTRLPAYTPYLSDSNYNAKSYTDKSRSLFGKFDGNKNIDWLMSETIRLQDDKNTIGKEVFGKNPKFTANSKISGPSIEVLVPVKTGGYKNYPVTASSSESLLNEIRRVSNSDAVIPGTIVNYSFKSKPDSVNNLSSLMLPFNDRFDDGVGTYGGIDSASINIIKGDNQNESSSYTPYLLIREKGKKKTITRSLDRGKTQVPTEVDDFFEGMIIKENGEVVYCINAGVPYPIYQNVNEDDRKSRRDEDINSKQYSDGLQKYVKYHSKIQDRYIPDENRDKLLEDVKRAFYILEQEEFKDTKVTTYEENNMMSSTEFKYVTTQSIIYRLTDKYKNSSKFTDSQEDYYLYTFSNPSLAYYSDTKDKIIKSKTDQIEKKINESKNKTSNYYISSEEIQDAVSLNLYTTAGTEVQNVMSGQVKKPLNFKKVKEDGQALKDIEFEIYKVVNGSRVLIDRWITDGHNKKIYLDSGKYILREKDSNGYQPLNDVIFTVSGSKVIEYIATKDRHTDIQTLDNGALISIPSKSSNSVIETVTEDLSNNPDTTIRNRDLEGNPLVTISDDGLTLTAKNIKNTKLQVSKKLLAADGNYHNLPGISFKLSSSGWEDRTATTNRIGIAVFDNLPLNSQWTLEEVKTEGLSEVFTKWDVNVDKNGKVTISGERNSKDPDDLFLIDPNDSSKITINNKPTTPPDTPPETPNDDKTSIVINKVDEEGEPLEGADFILIDPRDDKEISPSSKTNTSFTFTNLDYNVAYTLKETVAPKDYEKTGDRTIIIRRGGTKPQISESMGREIKVGSTTGDINNLSAKLNIRDNNNKVKTSNDYYAIANSYAKTNQENIELEIDFDLGNDVNPGDYFVIKDDYRTINGLNEETYYPPQIVDSNNPNVVLANGYHDKSNKTTKYVFTTNIRNLENRHMKLNLNNFILDSNIVTENQTVNLSFNVAGKDVNKTVKAIYPNFQYHSSYPNYMNHQAQVYSTNTEQGILRSVIYLNPDRTQENGQGPDRDTFIELSKFEEKKLSGLKLKDSNIKVYKVPFNQKYKYMTHSTGTLYKDKVSGTTLTDKAKDDGLRDITSQTQIIKHPNEDRVYIILPTTSNRWDGSGIIVDVQSPYDKSIGDPIFYYDWKTLENDYTGGVPSEKSGEAKVYGKLGILERTSSGIGSGDNKPSANEEPYEINIENIKKKSLYEFKIRKVNEYDTNNPIEGATFTLTGPNQSDETREMTTGKKGIISFGELEPGTYTLKEKSPAPGYQNTDKYWTIVITPEGKTYYKVNSNTNNVAYNDNNLFTEDKVLYKSSNILSNTANSLFNFFGTPVAYAASNVGGSKYEISNTKNQQVYGGTSVTTSVTDLGNNEFEVQIDLKNVSEKRVDDGGELNFTFNDDFSFVSGSTTTWKGNYDNAPTTRWHIGYDSNKKSINFYENEPKIYRNQTASIKFRVKAKDRLQAGSYNIINSIKYKHDTRSEVQTIEPPVVTVKGPSITYREESVRTNIPIPSTPERRSNSNMLEGEENVISNGEVGYRIDIYKYKYIDGVKQSNPEFVRNEITVDPKPKVIEYGTKAIQRSDSTRLKHVLEYETKEISDDTLPLGETRVEQEGKNGSIIYEYSIVYEKSEGDDESRPNDWPSNAPVANKRAGERVISYNKEEVDRVEPQDQIVRVGNKFVPNGEFKELSDTQYLEITNKPVELKIIKRNSEDKELSGAVFTLYTDKDAKNEINIQGIDANQETGPDGVAKFGPLPNGIYYLKETKAPADYVLLPKIWEIEVTDGKINIRDGNEKGKYEIVEETSNELEHLIVINRKATYPSTGGSGTFIGFALIGTAIMLAGIAYYGIYVNDKNRRRSNRYGK